MIRTAAATLFVMLAFSAFAQSSSEFGRASGGEIQVLAKHSRNLSGSIDLMRSNGHRVELSAGGALLDDKLWFFGSTSRGSFENVNAKASAQPVDWNHVTATFTQREETPLTLPASFLSLHSTAMLSDRSMMSISFSRQSVN